MHRREFYGPVVAKSIRPNGSRHATRDFSKAVVIADGADAADPPGGIATGIFGKVMGLSDEAAEETVEALKTGFKALRPIPRAGLADDIGRAADYLASDRSSFVNGLDMVIDGGLTGGRMWTSQQQALAAMRAAFGIDEPI